MRKIPATIVTGFLGAGKTSLIRHLIAHADGRRLAFVINEFGELGIDRELLLGWGIGDCRAEDVVELANGCICCTVADDFLPTLQGLLDRAEPPDHIVIETSALVLPQPLVQAFNWPEVKSRVSVDGVVVVIDAAAVAAGRFADDPAVLQAQRDADPAFDHDNPLEEVFSDQLRCADLVILNKMDLLDGAGRAALRATVAEQLRPAVKLIEATQGRVAPAVLLGLAAAAEDDLASRPSHLDAEGEHDHDDFESFVVERGPVADTAQFLGRLRAAIATHDILRLKGFLAGPGKELRQVVQGVGTRLQPYFDRPGGRGQAPAIRPRAVVRKGPDPAPLG